MIPSRFFRLGSLFLSLLAAGCASTARVKMYSGPRLDNERVAVVHPIPGFDYKLLGQRQDVRILRIDGVELKQADIDSHAAVELLPGEHSVTVATMFVRDGKSASYEDAVPFRYRFEAGMEYSIHCRLTPGPTPDQPVIRFWMEDASGTAVSSTG